MSRPQLFASMVGLSTGDQSRVVDISMLAEQEANKGACIREAGFDYRDARPEMLFDMAPQTSVHDLEFAKKFGFGIGIESFGGLTKNPNDQVLLGLSAAESRRWNEREIQCDDLAKQAIDGRLGELATLQKLADDATTLARTDPEFLSAQRRWKECMTQRGITFGGDSYWDLFDSFLDVANSAGGESKTEGLVEQKRAAVASAECDGTQWEVYRQAVSRAVKQLSPQMYELTAEFR